MPTVEKLFSQPLDDVLVLDVALEAGTSSRVVDEGKRIVEDTETGMLMEKEYYRLVRKYMLDKITDEEKDRLPSFRSKVDYPCPSSDWGLRLALWNNKLNDLSSISFDSSSSNDDKDDRPPTAEIARQAQLVRTYKRRRVTESSSSSHQVSSTETSSVEVSLVAILTLVSSGLSILGRSVLVLGLTAPFPVVSSMESISTTMSVAATSHISSSAIPTAPLFSLLPTSPSSSNLFATSKSTSLPPLSSDFLGMLSGATQIFVRPSSPIVQRHSRPRMVRPTSTKTGATSSRGVLMKVSFGSLPPTKHKQSAPRASTPRPTTPRPSRSRPSTPNSVPRPRGAAMEMQNFLEFARTKFIDVHRIVQRQIKLINENQEQIKKQQLEIVELRKKEVVQHQQNTNLFTQSKRQAIQFGILINMDVTTTAKHQTLVTATK
ncbi:hypothetical protein Hdeb2414_s0017g00509081 [Helianthus debilis subsp. tardiflorus]